jgi:hypothetical protein
MTKREPSGKKKGGQKGHEGHGLKIEAREIIYKKHQPEDCVQCANAGNCNAQERVKETRYEQDIVIEVETIAHEVIEKTCPMQGRTINGQFPDHVSSRIQYGTNIEGLAIALNTTGAVSINRVQELLSGIFSISISKGTIAAMVSEFAGKIKPIVNDIKTAIILAVQAYFDETGMRVDNKLKWSHIACTALLTYIRPFLSAKGTNME